MKKRQDTEHARIAYDALAGPIFGFRSIDMREAHRLSAGRDRPQIIEVLVWPYSEPRNQRPELRRYYCLNLPQAVARATELEIRLHEQERTAILVSLRPATIEETNDLFRAMDILEDQIPARSSLIDMKDRGLAARTDLCRNTGCSPETEACERFGPRRTNR